MLRAGARPALAEAVRFSQGHETRWGVEPLCRVLQIAPSSDDAAVRRPASPRQQRDAAVKVTSRRVWDAHRRAYGAAKVWAQLNREGTRGARCTVARLMRALGLRGVVRGKRSIRTPLGAEGSPRPAALGQRQVHAAAPTRLWVADRTSGKTQSGGG